MKQILDYFIIDGEVGGNQDWFRNVVMHIGGCAAATACDCCIYFAKYKGNQPAAGSPDSPGPGQNRRGR